MTGRFELLSELGAGGMGAVWKARDTESGEVVALKLVHAHLARDPDYVARFEREVEIARRIDSPRVVKVLGYGIRDGIPYMAMEHVEGQSLRDLLRERGTLPWDEAKPIVRQVAEGLAAAHAAGVIHRDVKPSNILITPDGSAKLADFGIARALDMTRLTGSSTMLGTPHYMAPDTEVTASSDLYSLGCVLYEMLTGRPPFEGESQQQVIVRHVRETVDLASIQPGEARRVVVGLLEKDPGHRRFAVIDTVVDSATPAATGSGGGLRVKLALLGVVAFVGLASAVGGFASGAFGGDEPDEANMPGDTSPTAAPSMVSTTPLPTAKPQWSVADIWDWPDEMFAQQTCGVTVTLDAPDAGCMVDFMREHGASERAVEFFEETGLFLTVFEELGAVDYGRSAAPWFNMGRPSPHLLLNGEPDLQDIPGLPDGWEADPEYAEFAAVHPDAFPWWEYGVLDAGTTASGIQELTLRYPLRSCRACDVLGVIAVVVSVDKDGRSKPAYLSEVAYEGPMPTDVPTATQGIATIVPPTALRPTATPEVLPDLVPVAAALIDGRTHLVVTVANRGDGYFSGGFLLGSGGFGIPPPSQTFVADIAPGTSAEFILDLGVTIDWDAVAQVAVDPNNTVRELREDNNTGAFALGPP